MYLINVDMKRIMQKYLFVAVMIIFLTAPALWSAAQENGVLGRLQAITNGGTDFYDADGVSVTHEVFS